MKLHTSIFIKLSFIFLSVPNLTRTTDGANMPQNWDDLPLEAKRALINASTREELAALARKYNLSKRICFMVERQQKLNQENIKTALRFIHKELKERRAKID